MCRLWANKAGVHMKNVELANEYLKVVKEYMGARGGYRRNLWC
jgi:hypothetical protein